MGSKAPLSYRTTKLTLGTFLRIMFRPRYLDRDKIPVEGPLIIAANHLSHIDPVGNYDEAYTESFCTYDDSGSCLIDRAGSQNAPYWEGGLQYAPPMR